jgi:hypothetical protein
MNTAGLRIRASVFLVIVYGSLRRIIIYAAGILARQP